MRQDKCKCRDAYLLMVYRSVNGKEQEVIWNSRDGPVPYCIEGKTQKVLLHTDLHRDTYRSKHILKPGDRYFADTTKERAEYLARKFVERNWGKPKFSKAYENLTPEEVVKILSETYYGEGHTPTLLEHGKDITTYISPSFRDAIKKDS